MIKKRTPGENREAHADPFAANLVELRPGLFLNRDHIVSVRVLPEVQPNGYAIMQLSSGDKLNLTREEFSTICGVDPRPPVKVLPRHPMKN